MCDVIDGNILMLIRMVSFFIVLLHHDQHRFFLDNYVIIVHNMYLKKFLNLILLAFDSFRVPLNVLELLLMFVRVIFFF